MISVIIPYKEDRGYLKQCIKSVEEQIYKDFEIIEAHGPGTLPQNFNNGLRKARGDYIKMVQDDDWLPPQSLNMLMFGIRSSRWVVGDVMQFPYNRRGKPGPPTLHKPPYLDFRSQVEKYDMHMGSTLYRKDLLDEIGGMDETLETGEEYDMHLKILSMGYEPAYISKVVYNYRMWSGGKSVIYRRDRTEWRKNELEKIKARYTNKV
jgi:glycosyltransferase involved in cell wall biosynthesis